MTDLNLHVDLPFFEASEGELLINGRSISDLARRAGGAFYAYDASVIRRRIADLRTGLPEGIEIHYAIKANPMSAVVEYVADLVDGLDVASGGELDIALRTPISRADISFAGPAKSVKELEQAVKAGIVVNVESIRELERISEIGKSLQCIPAIALRVNPDFELKSSGMRMSGGPKQFGIDAEQVPQVAEQLKKMALEFRGLHIFSGSQNLNAESICEAQRQSMDLALQLCEQIDLAPTFLNLGGGFGIPYFPGDQRLDVQPIADNLSLLQRRLGEVHPDCRIVIELGRYIVGEAGVYVCEVTDIKMSRGQKFLMTNGGLHHHLAASGNFGQVLRKNYPVTIANKLNASRSESVTVVGPLCTPLDLLADRMALPEACIGDLVAVFQSGAYGFTASPHLFLSHPAPKEIFCA